MSRRADGNRVLVDVTGVSAGARPQGARLRRLALRFMAQLGLTGCELSLSLVGDAAIRKLNAEWRQKDKATDVLSFPLGEWVGVGPRALGDVVISVMTARRQARERGVALEAELNRYLAHGVLHLLGLDHQRPSEARKMAAMETQLLGAEGMLAGSDELGQAGLRRSRRLK